MSTSDENPIAVARRVREHVDWSRYPKLRKIFEHRPSQNAYWIELINLIDELVQGEVVPSFTPEMERMLQIEIDRLKARNKK